MRLRRTITAVAALTAAALLAGCAAGPSVEAGNRGKSITVWLMKGTQSPMESFYAEVAAAFEKKTGGATVKIQEVSWSDAKNRFQTAIAGGTTPDVAEIGNTWTPEYADAGVLVPLTAHVSAELKADLVEGLTESGELDGELYGMPFYTAIRALMYRTDVLQSLGLAAPTTWDELVATATAVKTARPDLIPFPVPGDAEFSAYPWVWGAGGEVAERASDGTWTSRLDSAKSRAGLSFYTGLALDHGFSTAGAATWKETDVLDHFAQGEVAMAIQGSWTIGSVTTKNPDLAGKIASVPLPGEKSGMSPSAVGGSHLSVFNTTKHEDLAWQFVDLLSTGEYAQKFIETTGFFPAQKSALEKTIGSEDPAVRGFAQQLVEGGAAVPVTPAFGAVQAKQTTQSMVQAILSGRKTVDQATSDASAEMTTLLNGSR